MTNSTQLTGNELVEKWARTPLTKRQEKILDDFLRKDLQPGQDIEELKRKARVAYYLQALEPDLVSRKEKNAILEKSEYKAPVKLTKKQQAVKFTGEWDHAKKELKGGELYQMQKMGVTPDEARVHAERLHANIKRNSNSASMVWSNTQQKYISVEEAEERAKTKRTNARYL